jgi:hypothetical protein
MRRVLEIALDGDREIACDREVSRATAIVRASTRVPTRVSSSYKVFERRIIRNEGGNWWVQILESDVVRLGWLLGMRDVIDVQAPGQRRRRLLLGAKRFAKNIALLVAHTWSAGACDWFPYLVSYDWMVSCNRRL